MIRGIFFKFFFYLGFILICIIFLPALIMPSNIASCGGKLSGYWAKFCLRIFLSTKIIIKGLENIDRSNKFFIACTHQSQFETFFLQTIFKSDFKLRSVTSVIHATSWVVLRSFGVHSTFARRSFNASSAFVRRSTFDVRSTFIRLSFDVRSTFVRCLSDVCSTFDDRSTLSRCDVCLKL